MQGGPMAIVAYIIGVFPLIKRLKVDYTNVTHPWYSDDARALGMFNNLENVFNSLKRDGRDWGYYPKPTKTILIVHPDSL